MVYLVGKLYQKYKIKFAILCLLPVFSIQCSVEAEYNEQASEEQGLSPVVSSMGSSKQQSSNTISKTVRVEASSEGLQLSQSQVEFLLEINCENSGKSFASEQSPVISLARGDNCAAELKKLIIDQVSYDRVFDENSLRTDFYRHSEGSNTISLKLAYNNSIGLSNNSDLDQRAPVNDLVDLIFTYKAVNQGEKSTGGDSQKAILSSKESSNSASLAGHLAPKMQLLGLTNLNSGRSINQIEYVELLLQPDKLYDANELSFYYCNDKELTDCQENKSSYSEIKRKAIIANKS